jgi:hypothetical protein
MKKNVLDVRKTMINPHMYYWTKDELGREWRILLVGIYEEYSDGDNIVADLDVAEYWLEGTIYNPADVPDEISGFVDSLLDSSDTYTDIQREYEMVYKRG